MENQNPFCPGAWLLHMTPMLPEKAMTDEMSSTFVVACGNGSRNGCPQVRLFVVVDAMLMALPCCQVAQSFPVVSSLITSVSVRERLITVGKPASSVYRCLL